VRGRNKNRKNIENPTEGKQKAMVVHWTATSTWCDAGIPTL